MAKHKYQLSVLLNHQSSKMLLTILHAKKVRIELELRILMSYTSVISILNWTTICRNNIVFLKDWS